MNDNRYFGDPWDPNIALGEQAPAPLGQPCLHCGEAIEDGDKGLLMPYIAKDPARQEEMEDLAVPVHLDCFLRMLCGSVAHQQGACACHGGTGGDDPALSKREAAKAAVEYYESRQVCKECGGINGEHADDCEDMIDTVIVEEAGGD